MTKITNEMKLPFPSDRSGFMSSMKREVARSIGRIMADETKLEDLLGTLDVLRQYAIDKHEYQKDRLERAKKAKAAKITAELDLRLERNLSIVDTKRKVVADYSADIKKHDAAVKAAHKKDKASE